MIKGTLSPRMFWASVQLSVIFTGGSSDTFRPWTWDVSCSNKDENDKEEKREEDLCGGMSQRAQGVIILLYALILRGQDGEEGAKGWMKRDEWKEPKNEGSWGREWKVGNEGMKKGGVNTDIITQSQFTCSSQLLRFHSFSLCVQMFHRVPPRPTTFCWSFLWPSDLTSAHFSLRPTSESDVHVSYSRRWNLHIIGCWSNNNTV